MNNLRPLYGHLRQRKTGMLGRVDARREGFWMPTTEKDQRFPVETNPATRPETDAGLLVKFLRLAREKLGSQDFFEASGRYHEAPRKFDIVMGKLRSGPRARNGLIPRRHNNLWIRVNQLGIL